MTATPNSNVTEGTSVTLSQTPATGYRFDGWSLTPNTPVTNNTFNMPASDVTVKGDYSKIDYSITKDASNGSINIDKNKTTANYQDNISFKVVPNSGYELDGMPSVNNGAVPVTQNGDIYSFSMPADDVTISAIFTPQEEQQQPGGDDTGGVIPSLDFTSNPWGDPSIPTSLSTTGCNINDKNWHGITFDGQKGTATYWPTLRSASGSFRLVLSINNTLKITAPSGKRFEKIDLHYIYNSDRWYNGTNGSAYSVFSQDGTGTYTLAQGGDYGVWSGSATSVTIAVTGRGMWIGSIDFTLESTDGGNPIPDPTYCVNVINPLPTGCRTITATPDTDITADTKVTLSATPEDGYEFSSWNVTNASTSKQINVEDNQFSMPAADVNVSAVFNPIVNIAEVSLGSPTWSVGDVVEFGDVKNGVQITWSNADEAAVKEAENGRVFATFKLDRKMGDGEFETIRQEIFPLMVDANHPKPFINLFSDVFGNGKDPEPQSVADSYRITILELYTAIKVQDPLGDVYTNKTDYTPEESDLNRIKTFNVHKSFILLDITGTISANTVPGWKKDANNVVARTTGQTDTSNIQNSTYSGIMFTCDKETAMYYPYLQSSGLFMQRYSSLTIDAPTKKCFKSIKFYYSAPNSADGSNHDWNYSSGEHEYDAESISDTWTADDNYTSRLKIIGPNGATRITKIMFELDDLTSEPHTITISPSIENGMVTANLGNSAIKDAIVKLEVIPNTGYELETLTVKDSNDNLIDVVNKQFTMPDANVMVNATFRKVVYTITIDNRVENGSVSASHTTAYYDDVITLNNTPQKGYQFSSYTVSKSEGTVPVDDKGTFRMPAENVTVSGDFSKIPYDIYLSYKESDGKIVADAINNKAGIDTEVTLTVTPEPYFTCTSLTVTNNETSNKIAIRKVDDTKYKFTMPSSSVTVNAIFTEQAPGERIYVLEINSDCKDVDINGFEYKGIGFEVEEGENSVKPSLEIYNKELCLNVPKGSKLTITTPDYYQFRSMSFEFYNNNYECSVNDTWTEGSYNVSTKTWNANADNVTSVALTPSDLVIIKKITFVFDNCAYTIHTNAAGWASFSGAKAVTFKDSGATAYIVKNMDAETVRLKDIEEVPAREGVFVNGEPETDYIVNVVKNVDALVDDNFIEAILDPILGHVVTAEETAYALATKKIDGEAVAGLYKVNTGVTIKSKSYLRLPAGAQAAKLSMVFDDDNVATDIRNVNTGNENGVLYNLAGQRVSGMQKGIVIDSKGRKFFSK